MAIYEYVCTNEECEHEWEAEQRMSDDALTECPECGKETAKRLISRSTSFALKGGGWYSDLYSSTKKD